MSRARTFNGGHANHSIQEYWFKDSREEYLKLRFNLYEKIINFIYLESGDEVMEEVFNEFYKRLDPVGVDSNEFDYCFETWLIYLRVFENGKKGIKWFYDTHQDNLSDRENDLVEKWTRLTPKIVELSNKTEDGLWFTDCHTNERYFVKQETFIGDQSPWNINYALIGPDPNEDSAFLVERSHCMSPEYRDVLGELIENYNANGAFSTEETLALFHPEILSCVTKLRNHCGEFVGNPIIRKQWKYTYKIDGDLIEILEDLTETTEWAVNNFYEQKIELSLLEDWYIYEDNAVDEPIYLARNTARIEADILRDTLVFKTANSKKVKEFQDWIRTNFADCFILKDKMEEEVNVTLQEEKLSYSVHLPDYMPSYFGLLAIYRAIVEDLDRRIPFYGEQTINALLKYNLHHHIDRYLKQMEFMFDLLIKTGFPECEVTSDFNPLRKKLGLSASPFVSNASTRQSSLIPSEVSCFKFF